MHVQPVINSLQAALLNHSALAAADPSVEAAINQLVEAIGPALRLAAMDLAQQAAAEVSAQLPDHSVDVVISDGDPSLRVSDARAPTEKPSLEEFDARITLRLPPTLKQWIEDAAGDNGESVNGWVVDALSKRARRPGVPGSKVTHSFDL
jgi:hypothetical protein